MRKVLLLGLVGMLCVAAPASAADKLTVHRAKLEIRRAYIYAVGADPRLVTAGRCRRSRGVVNCRIVQRYDRATACFRAERWLTDGAATEQAPDPAIRDWGDCPIFATITPVDGQPTYDPPR